MPFSIYGDLVLPQASCGVCQGKISKVESFVLQRMFGVQRRKLGFRSQTKKKRRNKITATVYRIEDDGTETPIELNLDQFPWYSWALPIYEVPGITWLEPIDSIKKQDRFTTQVSQMDSAAALAAGGGRHPVRSQMIFNPKMFMRFLAKMAHAYACAVLGPDGFEHFLPPLILGDEYVEPRVVVGGEREIEDPRPEVYEIALGTMTRSDGVVFLSAKIRLFSYMGTPTYTVAVGQGFHDDISTIKNCAHAKAIKITVVGADGKPIFGVGV